MKKSFTYNKPELKEFRRQLRNDGTSAEAVMWTYLKRKQLGKKFRRQDSVENYILDFYCPEERLAIELDGAHHFTSSGYEYDRERTAFLHSYDIRVVRFENCEVFDNPEWVLEKIRSCFGK